ncbi:MAG: hypothetical protein AAB432_02680, partial [Patescibacteria group bacterium]
SWGLGSGQNQVEVWRKVGAGNFNLFQTLSSSATTYTDSPLTTNETYFYKMRTCSTSGSYSACSAFSPEKQVVVASAPQNVKASLIYTDLAVATPYGNVLLTWNNTFPEENYNVERANSSRVFNIVHRVGGPNDAVPIVSYYDNNVPLGEQYFYRIVSDLSPDYSVESSINLNVSKVLHGAAWAEAGDSHGIGWISFNSETASPKFSVQIDRDGLFSGAAWASADSEHGYGWLSFNKVDLLNCPQAPCEATLDSNNFVRGWAKFINVDPQGFSGWVSLASADAPIPQPSPPPPPKNPPPPAGFQKAQPIGQEPNFLSNLLSGNFFGDIISSLSNTFEAFAQRIVVTYGVNYSSNPPNFDFKGIAWGGDITGWIAFNSPECTNCNVHAEIFNKPPTVSNVTVTKNNWCSEDPYYDVSWDFNDPDQTPVGSGQLSADINFIDGGGNIVYAAHPVSAINKFRLHNPLGSLNPSTIYHVEVRANDNDGAAYSAYSASSNFTTESHYPPLTDFTWTPTAVQPGTTVQFTNQTQMREPSKPPFTYLWNFTNSGTVNSTVENPQVVFNALPATVTFYVTDSNSAQCSFAKQVDSTGGQASQKRRLYQER